MSESEGKPTEESQQEACTPPLAPVVRRPVGSVSLGWSDYDDDFWAWAGEHEARYPHNKEWAGCCCEYDLQHLWPELMLCGCEFEADRENDAIHITYPGEIEELIRKMSGELEQEDA